jgi:hypothetical protein
MDTWVPIAVVVLLVVVGIAVLVVRATRSRGAPGDPEDDATRKEADEAYYRSQRDQTGLPPGDRRRGTGGASRQ